MRVLKESWTERELAQEINRLSEKLAATSQRTDERGRNASSYLQQVLRDRQDRLSVLRQQRVRPVH